MVSQAHSHSASKRTCSDLIPFLPPSRLLSDCVGYSGFIDTLARSDEVYSSGPGVTRNGKLRPLTNKETPVCAGFLLLLVM
jgi:hypothetical protein